MILRLSINKHMKTLRKFFHSNTILSFLSVTLLTLWTGCSPDSNNQSKAAGSLSLDSVVIALKANKNPESMLTEKQALELYLSTKLKRKVKVIIPTDSSIVVESFRNGTLDLGYLSSTDAARNLDQKTASVLLIHLKNGKPHYDSVWLSRKEGNYQSIEDLRDKPVAFASRSSTSGFLIPCLDLAGRGLVGSDTSLNDFFSQTIYGTGYTSAVEKVLSGEVEAAAVSDYVFKGDNKYLSDEQKSRLRIIQHQGPVPSHTLCVRSTLSAEDQSIIKSALLEMNEENPSLRDQAFNGVLVEVNATEHLRVTREALALQNTLKQ